MPRLIKRNSKKGLSLPIAVVVTCFIIIIATTLLSVAMTSIEKTSASVDTRQAYLNAKAALDYAADFYENENLPEEATGTADEYAEYIVMNDSGGTANEGATVLALANESKASSYNTYVYALYNSQTSKLKLTAYAASSDSFGGHVETTKLSVTYEINETTEGNLNRRLSTSLELKSNTASSDTVYIHVKKYNSDDYNPIVYAWSYTKRDGLGIDWDNVKDITDLTVDQANAIENNTYVKTVIGEWVNYTVATKNSKTLSGPVGEKMEKEGNNWWVTSYSPSEWNTVPWVSIIISRQAVDENEQIGSKLDGTQTSEMLNVWYFDEDDRNIYVELLASFKDMTLDGVNRIQYYSGTNWDGLKTLSDRVVAYANAKQTVYYVRMKGVTDESLQPTVTIGNKSYDASYSGYGWWSVRGEDIGSSDRKDVSVSSSLMGNSVTVSSVKSGSVNTIEGRSAYIVIEQGEAKVDGSYDYTARSFITEEAASVYMNDEDYVTVYAKVYDRTKSASPTISYGVESTSSSAAKLSLKNAITDAEALYEADYEADSWNEFIKIVNTAKEVYNMEELQENSVYEEQEKEIEAAKSALVVKQADLTELEKEIAVSEALVETDYTTESYSTFSTSLKTAKEYVDAAKNGSAVNQETIDKVKRNLSSARNTLTGDNDNLAATWRSKLENAISQAQTVYDNNQNADVNLLNNLSAAISEAEAVYKSEKISQTLAEEALKKLASATSKITNVGDVDSLQEKIKEAKSLIDENKDILVEGTVTNLESVIAAIEEIIEADINQTQTAVDAYMEMLEEAIDALVYLPQDTATFDVAEGKQRIWFDIDMEKFGDECYVYAWNGNDSNISFNTLTSTSTEKEQFKIKNDSVSGYYYFDLDTKYTGIVVVSGTGETWNQTKDISLNTTEGYNFFTFGDTYETGDDKINKFSVGSGYLTTVYTEKDVPDTWGTTSQYAYITNDNTTSNAGEFSTKTDDTDSTGKYLRKRVTFSNIGATITLKNGNGSSANSTKAMKLTTDPMVIRFTDKSNTDTTADTYVTAKTYDELCDLTVSTTVTKVSSSDASSASVEKLAVDADGEYTDEYIPSNSLITVYFKKPDSWSGNIKAILSRYDDSGNQLNIQSTERLLITDDWSEYYMVVDTNNVNSITIECDGGDSTGAKAVRFGVDSSTGKYYTTQLIAQNSAGEWTAMAYTTSVTTIDTTNVSFAADCSNISMAYIGGRKRFFTNVSALDITYAGGNASNRKDANNGTTLSSSKKFTNHYSGLGRVGYTEYSEYYDWYEYKIPAAESDLYNFEITGLDNSDDSTKKYKTQQVHQVWGDVWVTLSTNAKENGILTNVCVYTVNPDEEITTDTTTIYIDEIPSWESHGGITVNMWGVGSQTVELTEDEQYDGKYTVDVPKNMPFIQLVSGDGTQALPMTKLQGGDKIEYHYSAGAAGTPAWLSYTPGYIALRDEWSSSLNVVNTWRIFSDYNLTTKKKGSSCYPMALDKQRKLYTSDKSADPDSQRNQAAALAEWREAYEDLYDIISKARTYITMDANGKEVYFPENDNNTLGIKYSDDQIKELYTLMSKAVSDYGSESSTLSTILKDISDLNDAIESLTPELTDTTVLILDDTAGWDSNIWVEYTDSSGITQNRAVTSKNAEGYPMIYVTVAENKTITNVRFYKKSGTEDISGATKGEIGHEETWVCDNSLSTSDAWKKNTLENYYVYTVKNYTQTETGGVKSTMIVGDSDSEEHKDFAVEFTLYFENETTVTYYDGDEERSYTILPGAYVINKGGENYTSCYTGDNANKPTHVDLFTRTAENFFTSSTNQGFYEDGKDSDSSAIGWTSDGEIKTHVGPYTAGSSSVNFKASSGKLNGSYSAGKISFRWYDDDNSLKVTSGTTFIADEIKIASASTISGGTTLSPKFTLKCRTLGNKLKVTFMTDVTVTYYDTTGSLISYTIPAGTYTSRNADVELNLFNKSDWSKMTTYDKTETDDGSSGGGVAPGAEGAKLTKPVWSLD